MIKWFDIYIGICFIGAIVIVWCGVNALRGPKILWLLYEPLIRALTKQKNGPDAQKQTEGL